jgi:hypothetical protein
MSVKPILFAVLFATLPIVAQAESQACQATCEAYRDCAESPLRAIYDGVFSSEDCTNYDDCQQMVFQCRARAGSCQSECDDPQAGG